MSRNDSQQSRRGFLQWSAAIAGAAAPLVALGDDAPTKTQDTKTEQSAPKSDAAKPQPASSPEVKTETKATAAAATTQNTKLNIAIVGVGGQGRHNMLNLLTLKQNIVAVCDVDERGIAQAIKAGKEPLATAKTFTDYRKLLDQEKAYDAVLIATPDHWHAPLCKAFIKAGKHVYCEKPLTHSIAEVRELRELAKSNPKIVTQMGNQGSAESSVRRSVELIRAGVLGQVREVHAWLDGGGFPHANDRPRGGDSIPIGFNWDFWCGPSPYRPFKDKIYHPFAWRGWFDFGNGQLADFTCHIFNTAMRSLELTYPTKIEVSGTQLGKECYGTSNVLKMHFPARQGKEPIRSLDPLTLHWYDGGPRPDDEILKDVIEAYKKPPHGCLIVGEKGVLFSNPWNVSAAIKLNGDPRLKDVLRHEATKDIPTTLPRGMTHWEEWVKACLGQAKTWSDFEFGGHLTEIGLTGVMALRIGHEIDWDGEQMIARNAPQAHQIIRPEYRKAWL
jgi:predicted dehydrogenase